MPVTDIATRVYNHGWRLDPFVRSLLDTDFYKLLMLQLIWRHHADFTATFSLINRTTAVRLAEVIDEAKLREQLDNGGSGDAGDRPSARTPPGQRPTGQ